MLGEATVGDPSVSDLSLLPIHSRPSPSMEIRRNHVDVTNDDTTRTEPSSLVPARVMTKGQLLLLSAAVGRRDYIAGHDSQ